MLQIAAFYILAVVALVSAIMVVSARNPVHSVMFLITIFVTTAGLFVLAGAEYLAMLLIVVYVGAVAVLFLFVVMMLDIDFVELKQGFLNYAPLGGLVSLILFAMFVLVGSAWVEGKTDPKVLASPTPNPELIDNTSALGHIIYTDYILFFQLAGMVLFVAMIGAIVLTLRHKNYVKRQNVSKQVARSRQNAVENTKPKIGEGVSL